MREVCLYQLYLVVLSSKELMVDKEVLQAFQNVLDQTDDISSAFLNEFLILTGRKILDLMDASKVKEDDKDQLDQAQTQIMQSELLSGGLPMHLFAYFSIP